MTGPYVPIESGIPVVIGIEPTPIHGLSLPPGPTHPDLEETLRRMNETLQTLSTHLTPEQQAALRRGPSPSESIEDDEFITSIVKEVSRKQMAGKILMWVAGIIGIIFSAGMTYQLMVGENATDHEVSEAVRKAVVDHNGGKDPETINDNGEKNGHHPDLRHAIEDNGKTLTTVKRDVGEIKTSQKMANKRGEYQFEFSRWQAEVTECERKRGCRAPKKPQKLKTLESDLMLGKFD